MSWNGAARSNYVQIADMDGLMKALEPFSDITIESGDRGEGNCFLVQTDDGGWPSWGEVERADPEDPENTILEEIEFDPAVHIMPFLVPDQVLITMQSGHDKLRYIDGSAAAYHTDGRKVSFGLFEIYEKAAKEFGIPQERISACEY